MTSSPCGVLAPIGRRSVGVGQVHGGVDQRDVRERLREVADQAPAPRVVLLGEQADVVAQRQQPLEQRVARRRVRPLQARSCRPARRCRRGTRPRPPAGRRRRRRRSVARDEAVVASASRSIAATVPTHARVVGRQEADQRDHQQAGVELASTRRTAMNVLRARVEAARGRPRRGSRSRSRRQRVDRARRGRSARPPSTARSNATQAMTFECVKCRRGPRTSQMPSSGSLPAPLEEVEQRAARSRQPSSLGIEADCGAPGSSASITSP